jgi:hypothetical protein
LASVAFAGKMARAALAWASPCRGCWSKSWVRSRSGVGLADESSSLVAYDVRGCCVPAPDPTTDHRRSTPSPRSGSPGVRAYEESEPSGELHQILRRDVNERIEQLNGEWEQTDRDVVLCECGYSDCLEKIEIAAADYERVRRFPTRFLVKPDHVMGGSERIVERTHVYVVVEKVGESAATALRRDPRRTPLSKQAPLR